MENNYKSRILPGHVVKHFKHDFTENENSDHYIYRVLCFAKYSDTGEKYVVYQAMYSDPEKDIDIGDIFVRPFDDFMSKVDKEKYPEAKQEYRFEPIAN